MKTKKSSLLIIVIGAILLFGAVAYYRIESINISTAIIPGWHMSIHPPFGKAGLMVTAIIGCFMVIEGVIRYRKNRS